MIEEWREVIGYEGIYEVSNLGCVRSIDRLDSQGHRRKGRILKQWLVNERPFTTLCNSGVNHAALVSEIVAKAFIGPRPSGQYVRHNDGDTTNTRASNLTYGPSLRKGNLTNVKLTAAQVIEIRRLLAKGLSCAKIGKQFGVGAATVNNISTKRTWAHLQSSVQSIAFENASASAAASMQSIASGGAAISRTENEGKEHG